MERHRERPEGAAEANGKPTLDDCFAPGGADLTLIAETLAMNPAE